MVEHLGDRPKYKLYDLINDQNVVAPKNLQHMSVVSRLPHVKYVTVERSDGNIKIEG